MSTRINTNSTASLAATNLSANSDKVSKNIQRLSSGLRINSAADDAAGLVISQSLAAQSNGLTQATSNTNDAINVAKTAEGALNEVQSLLINIRQTIVHAANVGANNTTALQADKDSVAASVASIDRIASTTQFNGKNLLDGSSNSSGAAVTGGTATVNAAAGKNLNIVAQAAGYGAAAISSGNVTSAAATATVSTVTLGAAPSDGTFGGNFNIEGKAVTLNGTTNTVAQIATAIQQQTGLNYGVAISGSTVVFTDQATGKPASTSTFSGLTSSTASATYTSAATVAGTNASVTVNGQTSDTVSTDGKTFSFTTGALKGLALSTNSTLGGTLGTFSATADKAVSGNDLKFQIGANQNQTVSLSIDSQKSDNIGSYKNTAGSTFKLADLLAGGGLDLGDVTGKSQQDALAVVDQAISDISTTREKLGSTQSNVLQSNLNSLAVAQQNTDASLSTIRDTNLSSEIVDFTKNQILVQAGTSALAQANSAPQAILKLLQ